ncbi:MAG: type IV secretion system DNA-binding domain-containing protein, partial [Gammaproteobacteria bacterium]|nr:type IV secretion system DNA-binding domain-containing protein [Gammaproteobacteria bacterium]
MLHGWGGLLSAYSLMEGSLLVGLVRGRAGLHKLALSPFAALPLTAVGGLGIATAAGIMRDLGLAAGGVLQLCAGIAGTAALGYGVGRVVARGPSSLVRHERGALVSQLSASVARGGASRRAARVRSRFRGITLAGIPIAAEDEAKHFKLLGTTGTGKSTAIREMLTAALARGDRAVIADPDGSYLRHFYDANRGDV